jgi:hypothetical protein
LPVLELARFTQRCSRACRFIVGATAVVVTLLLGFSYYYFGPRAREPIIEQTVPLKKLAAEIEQNGGKEFPLTHVDDPMALQVYLNTLRPRVSYERAAQLLRGSEPAYVAMNDLKNWNRLKGG